LRPNAEAAVEIPLNSMGDTSCFDEISEALSLFKGTTWIFFREAVYGTLLLLRNDAEFILTCACPSLG